MNKFSVGEVAIGCSFSVDTEYNDMECEIVSGLKVRDFIGKTTRILRSGDCYKVRWADGYESTVRPFRLRKKKPPSEEINWVEKLSLVKWSPNKQKAGV